MEVIKAILNRRSVRLYKKDKIDRAILDSLIEAGRWAPSANNLQPWVFIIIDDYDLILKIKSFSPGIFNMPTFIIAICINNNIVEESGVIDKGLPLIDISLSAQNILLYSYSKGIGTCLIRSFHKKGITKLLSCPEWVVPELLIIGGFPAKESPIPFKKQLNEIRYFNIWKN